MKRVQVLADYLNVDKKEIEVNGNILIHNQNEYEVMKRKELKEKEFETFKSCYYSEHLKAMRIGLEFQFSGELYKSYGHINKDVEIKEEDKKIIDTIMNSFIVSPKKAFKKSNFFEISIQQYPKVGKYFIVAF